MGQVMKLKELVIDLESLDEAATIYVAEPWSVDALALAEVESSAGGLPDNAAKGRFKYFLEVAIARDFLSDWEIGLERPVSIDEKCDRLIRYAIDDA